MSRSTRAPGNLPADATSFVGRRVELAGLRTKLATSRLVSLVGPGGVGKTRLAIRIATELGRRFPDGAWLVELAEVRDQALVDNAVLEALDLRDQTATQPRKLVLSYLRDKELLLVIDNCEHVLEVAAQLVTEVIKAAPLVRVIATSREPLAVTSEQVVPVRPLELPSADSAESLSQLLHNEAISLFSDRAAAASGTFDVTDLNRRAVVDLCRRLDGLPLAIELAAVRTRALTPEQILERLSDRFGLLMGGGRAALPRHQTLHTAFEWSHELLSDAERMLLRRLCVFAGRFTLEDVESVCTSGDALATDALELMCSLVDKSLVVREDVTGRACYRLHETMRDYAGLKLRDAGEQEATERRHAQHYRSRCQHSAAEARYRLVDWLAWIDLEIDNVRSVLQRCLSNGDVELGTELATFMWWYWTTRATTEGVRWLDAFLAAGRGDPSAHSWPLFIRGFLAVLQGDPTAAQPVLRQAIEAARATRQLQLLSQSLSMASIAEIWAGDRASASRLLDEAQEVTGGLDDVPATLGFLQARALNGFLAGDLDTVRSAATDGVRLSREAGDLYVLDMMLLNLGLVALTAGDLTGSKQLLVEGLRIAYQVDDRVAQFLWLDALSCHAVSSGQAGLGAQLLGAADTMRTGAGASVNAVLAPLMARAEESAAAALGATKFRAEFNAGKRLSRDAVRGLALGETAGPAGSASYDDWARLLAKRETDVARLVADGLSNKQIGARLFISERTVESHVRSILNKLGLNTRVQIANWVSSSNHASTAERV